MIVATSSTRRQIAPSGSAWTARAEVPLPSGRLTGGLDLRQLPIAAVTLREWAVRLADHPDKASGFERVAALSLAIGPLQKRMLEWISHHALLTPSDLATLMEIRESLADKLLSGLDARELVRPLPQSDTAMPTVSRYVLTPAGLRLLAARDGVPPRRYVRYGVIAAPNEGKTSRRLETLVGQFQHTTGANSFFVRLKRDVDAAGGRLLRWLNASESTVQFTYKEKRHWLRPDGCAEFQLGGEVHRFFLEWDRGTTRHSKHLTEKFQNYAGYFAVRVEANDGPDLLIVTVSPHRESVIWNILKRSFSGQPPANVLTSIDSLVERLGPFGPVWRGSGDKGRRRWA